MTGPTSKPTPEPADDAGAVGNVYRIPTDEECLDYGIPVDESYFHVIGPNGFWEGYGEPEDNSFLRDGRGIITELNRLHALAAQPEPSDDLAAECERLRGLLREVLAHNITDEPACDGDDTHRYTWTVYEDIREKAGTLATGLRDRIDAALREKEQSDG